MEISSDTLKGPVDIEAEPKPGNGDNAEVIKWTAEEEKAFLRKIDFYILPGLSLLYLLCFLDRTFAPHPDT